MIKCYFIGEGSDIDDVKKLVEKHPFAELIDDHGTGQPVLEEIFAKKPQVLFVDFAMRKTIKKVLARLMQFSAIIYMSVTPSDAFEAFEDGAIDYMSYPVRSKRFEVCMSKIVRLSLNRTSFLQEVPEHGLDSFFINVDAKGKTELLINSNEILMIEAIENHILLTMVEGRKHICFNTMKEMEEYLPNYLIRVHKSFIINYRKVSEVKGPLLTLKGNTQKIPIGVTYRKAFTEKKNEMTIGKKNVKRF
ncbi:LytR/AlgR family response regulator transcription factor [Pedobacter sp. SG918]|uniref:LytR/AlgR family response regulator transcription factor n=1 Tax=Pedobacter sp. SG918 TaxID=2587136 RepID=UPI00146ED60F|nr:LytTR family DNA-binding domain-containing protein [Pedobacter sp. SG918]NMN37569.1 two-component system LytT family response regulator [Pedobacter sp. SG918]